MDIFQKLAIEAKTPKPKTFVKAIRYEIREYIGNSFSKSMSPKLKTLTQASKLVKRLRKMGHDAFRVPVLITVPK